MAARCTAMTQFLHGGMQEYTIIIKRAGDWWIGWIEEVPGVNCQSGAAKSCWRR